jgi:hypothetical protein
VYLAAGVMALFGTEMGFLLALLGLQEMVMALWLIVKGFNSSAITAENKETRHEHN